MGGEKQIRVCFVSDDSTSLTGGARSQASLMKGLSQQGVQPFFVSHRQTVQVDNARKNGYTVAVIPARLYTNPRGRNRVRSVLMYPVKRLYNALQRQKIDGMAGQERITITYRADQREEAHRKAASLRAQGRCVELIRVG